MKKNYSLIIAVFGFAAMVQLVFYWLAPPVEAYQTIRAWLFVVAGVIPVALTCTVVFTDLNFLGVPMLIVVGFGGLAAAVTAAVLLAADATPRTSMFVFAVLGLIEVVCTAPFIPFKSSYAAQSGGREDPGGGEVIPYNYDNVDYEELEE